ncbi:hypothetical protein ACQKK5_22820 [Brevibacillus panacihumi]|uniref:hypothetical protein n=1 Tax=Brevibacillus panacihumi TaxID=497735 RepID=UPI003D04FF44
MMVHSEEPNKRSKTNESLQASSDYAEALEQSGTAEASDEFGPDIGIPSNYEANQVGQKKSMSGFEVSRDIGRL